MLRLFSFLCLVGLIALFSGCLASPVAQSGGPGATTIPNSNAGAIAAAARTVFANYGYTLGPGNFPNSISFERPAGSFGQLMFGSYGQSTTFRVRLQIHSIPGTSDFRVVPRVSRVNNAGEAGFESDTNMMRFWSGQFNSIMRDIRKRASNAGGGF